MELNKALELALRRVQERRKLMAEISSDVVKGMGVAVGQPEIIKTLRKYDDVERALTCLFSYRNIMDDVSFISVVESLMAFCFVEGQERTLRREVRQDEK